MPRGCHVAKLLKALAVIAILAATLSSFPVCAQEYPSKPITIIVPYGPGSAMDNVIRLISASLQTLLGQPVVVDNKGGANGVVGTQQAAHASPNGYTFLAGSSTTLAANVGLYKSLPYDPQKDFSAVAGLASTSMIFLVRTDSSTKNLQAFLAEAATQKRPVPVGYGSSSAQVALAMLSQASGVEFTGVPYKTSPQAIMDLTGGQIPMAIVDVGNGVAQVKGGRLSALAVSSPSRSEFLPDVPTLAETWPGAQLVTWIGLVAPAGTPSPIIGRVYDAIAKSLANPEVKQQFAGLSTEVDLVSPGDLADRMQRDQQQWLKLIKAAGIQPE